MKIRLSNWEEYMATDFLDLQQLADDNQNEGVSYGEMAGLQSVKETMKGSSNQTILRGELEKIGFKLLIK